MIPRPSRGASQRPEPRPEPASTSGHDRRSYTTAWGTTRAAAEAIIAERRKASQKTCRTCRKELPLGAFAPYARSKDGHRRSCRKCVATGRAPKKQHTPEQKARAAELRKQPHRKAANLEAVYKWRAANPDAIAAHAAVDAALKAGEIVPAKTCQAADCRKRRGLASHHNSYAASRRKVVVWLCNSHHRTAHSGRLVPLKKSAGAKVARAPNAA